MVSIEFLKEAGSFMAILCYGLAKDVADFCRRLEEELPHDWSDGTVSVDWANHSQVYVPALTFIVDGCYRIHFSLKMLVTNDI
jgi:hypothetical protein